MAIMQEHVVSFWDEEPMKEVYKQPDLYQAGILEDYDQKAISTSWN